MTVWTWCVAIPTDLVLELMWTQTKTGICGDNIYSQDNHHLAIVYQTLSSDTQLPCRKEKHKTLKDGVNGRPSKILKKKFKPFVTVRMRFLAVLLSANALHVRWGPFNPPKDLRMHIARNGLHRTKFFAGCMVAESWHAFCSDLVRFLPYTCPIRIRWCPVGRIRS